MLCAYTHNIANIGAFNTSLKSLMLKTPKRDNRQRHEERYLRISPILRSRISICELWVNSLLSPSADALHRQRYLPRQWTHTHSRAEQRERRKMSFPVPLSTPPSRSSDQGEEEGPLSSSVIVFPPQTALSITHTGQGASNRNNTPVCSNLSLCLPILHPL